MMSLANAYNYYYIIINKLDQQCLNFNLNMAQHFVLLDFSDICAD